MSEQPSIDLKDPAFKANPYPTYASFREEGPVRRVTFRAQPAWLITRYDDAMAALKDPRLVKDLSGQRMDMISTDGARHRHLRSVVQSALSAPSAERIRMHADELIDAIAGRGEADLVDAYASPLPMLVLGELLDLPRKDHEQLRAWLTIAVSPEPCPEISRYLGPVIEARRRNPGPGFLSALIRASEAQEISKLELYSTVHLMLAAGHESTSNLIGSGMLALFQHPKQLEALKKDPSLIGTAVEELLRYCNPLEVATHRFAREDIEIGGARIPRGAVVFVGLASANRDGARIQRPDELDITRAENKHIAFGFGAHYCIAAALGRVQGQIAISTLLRRLPDLRLAVPPESLSWHPHLIFRGLLRLPVVFSAARGES